MIDTEVARTFDRRSALFLTGGAILTSVLIMRMLQMQVFEYKNYLRKSENNSFRIQVTMPQRGSILSESGGIISRDAPIYRIYVVPEETDDIKSTIELIEKELKLRKKTIDRIWRNIKKQQKFQPFFTAVVRRTGLGDRDSLYFVLHAARRCKSDGDLYWGDGERGVFVAFGAILSRDCDRSFG